MIYPNSPEIELRSMVNILDRETHGLAEEFIDLPRDEQLDRINDLRVLVQSIKLVTDEVTA